jgi:hypothetical protein
VHIRQVDVAACVGFDGSIERLGKGGGLVILLDFRGWSGLRGWRWFEAWSGGLLLDWCGFGSSILLATFSGSDWAVPLSCFSRPMPRASRVSPALKAARSSRWRCRSS